MMLPSISPVSALPRTPNAAHGREGRSSRQGGGRSPQQAFIEKRLSKLEAALQAREVENKALEKRVVELLHKVDEGEQRLANAEASARRRCKALEAQLEELQETNRALAGQERIQKLEREKQVRGVRIFEAERRLELAQERAASAVRVKDVLSIKLTKSTLENEELTQRLERAEEAEVSHKAQQSALHIKLRECNRALAFTTEQLESREEECAHLRVENMMRQERVDELLRAQASPTRGRSTSPTRAARRGSFSDEAATLREDVAELRKALGLCEAERAQLQGATQQASARAAEQLEQMDALVRRVNELSQQAQRE